jgi:hypothetical protein
MRAASYLIPATIAFSFLLPQSLQAAINLPGGGKVEKVDFERHVMGLFGKTGCNNGSCHGSFQGKNGFRLSLFGYEPERDFLALTRDIHGRRIDRIDPDASLLLQKAVGSQKHDGGARFGNESWQYQIIREWIQQGAQWTKGSGEIASLSLEPKEYAFVPAGKTVQVKVMAKFADGSTEEITPFCDFRVSDDAVATITSTGLIRSVKPGDAGLVVLYRGQVQSARILVPAPGKPGTSTGKEVNYIDREVGAKLKMMNMSRSDETNDIEFLRRITIDTTGTLPTPEEVRAFLGDKSPNKREEKIEELLKHPLHAALWATKMSDITGNNTDALENPQQLKAARSQMWHDWFRKRFLENMPYDQIVEGVLTATSREGMTPEAWLDQTKKIDASIAKFETETYASRKTLDLFWRRQQVVPVDQWGQKVAAAFLGVRLECAECHKHPTDRWTQADYRSFANFFTSVGFPNNVFSDPELKKLADAENAKRREAMTTPNNNNINLVREVFLTPNNRGANVLVHPDTGKPLPPKALGGPEITKSGSDIREDLFKWMKTPDNPFFARSFVNRIWAHYLGIGLVDPVDDFSVANPPTNARLLDALAKEFIEHNFDIRHIERQILLSRTYQTSSMPNESNKFDKNNYARSYIRPMMAEVVVDVLNTSLGATETYNANDAPAGKKLIEVGASRFLGNQNLTYVLRIFGRPPRTTACDCERTMDPALPQTLFRMTDPAVLAKLRLPTGRINTLVKSKKTDDEIFEEIFLATLSRFPNDDEKSAFASHKKNSSDRASMFVDVMWALINTREFILNH